MLEDRRKFIRYHLECPVIIITSQGSISGQTMNLSADGAFICCKQSLNPKESVDVSIRFPDGVSMEVPCEVVWSSETAPGGEKRLRGMGVYFLR